VAAQRLIDLAGAAIVVALGVRTGWLFLAHALHVPGTYRFHVESAALGFAVAGLVFKILRRSASSAAPSGPTRSLEPLGDYGPSPRNPGLDAIPGVTLWLAFVIVAFALYWPALTIGLLSDDFVLVDRAAHWQLGGVTAIFSRPVPLFLWAVLLSAGAGPVVLHGLNLTLHATNAFLTARVLDGWVRDRAWSVCAGLLMLTAPLGPEAVAWCSGVFDLLATTLVLSAVLVSRRYDDAPSRGTRAAFITLGLAAVASKETAIVVAALVVVDALARGVRPRKLWLDAAVVLGLAGAFGVARVARAFGTSPPASSRYDVQRVLFGSVGALAVPWHVDVSAAYPWLPIATVLMTLVIALAFFIRPSPRRQTALALLALTVTLLPILPVWPMFFVAPDLQGARYLYMASVGWAGLAVVLAGQAGERPPRAGGGGLRSWPLAVIAGLLTASAIGTRLHLAPWREAARLRDDVEAAARSSVRSTCSGTIAVSGLPDSVRGAYVFRNGVREAFARDLHLSVVEGPAGPCSLKWVRDGL
jgi:hypothetical protein